jgi:DNA invertase Pin-like site-specific DNA recombinase
MFRRVSYDLAKNFSFRPGRYRKLSGVCGCEAIMGAMAQMERELKAERTAAGRASAKARGRTGGRPRMDSEKLEHARILYLNSGKTAAEVCQMVGIGRRTLFSYLAQVRQREQVKSPQ